jgi:hypothetical protein
MGFTPIVFRPVVLQSELRQIVALRAEIAYRHHTLTGYEESVLMRLVKGADVEPGHHQVWLHELVKGKMRKQLLEVR